MSASSVISSLPTKYDQALADGDLLYFPSTVDKHVESGVEFEIRLCPALQEKPGSPSPHFGRIQEDGTTKKPDPFSPPYIPNLFLGELSSPELDDEHAILLNKYSVIPHHFLLVTKEFRSQASPLMPSDLVHTYRIISAAQEAGRHFFAFYNCGDVSGASQPHKHLQFVSPETPDGPPVEKLANSTQLETPGKPFTLSQLPYANHLFRFPSDMSAFPPDRLEESLAQIFLSLLDLGISTIRHAPDYPPGKPSYNVIITRQHMHLIPRGRETHKLAETGEDLSVNALGFAGMLLVKSEKELEAVKREGVGKILRSVGLESVHDLQLVGETGER